MQLLLDTHALIWWLIGDSSLSAAAKDGIADADNEVFVSAASAWEIATKFRIGKLPQGVALVAKFPEALASQGFNGLPITLEHGRAAGSLPGPHRDPFDRMLIAQAIFSDFVLVSNETIFDVYGVRRLW